MKILPCPNTPDGKHVWRYDQRQHGDKFRHFMKCTKCKQRAQESASGKKFNTAREFTHVKTVTGSYRTWKQRKAEILAAGYKSIGEYIDQSPIVKKSVI